MGAGSGQSLHSMLTGIQVAPEDLHSAADWIRAVGDHWDDAVVGGLRTTVGPHPAAAGSPGGASGALHGYGRFDEADNLGRVVGDARDALAARIHRIATLLDDLRKVTDRIADNYENTEVDNAAHQKQLISILDAATAPSTKATR
ncbi:MAG: hypothetical protein WCA46_26690 [Actinocatenispora sp.]